MKQFIPKHKYDIETVEQLNNYSIEELRPIIPELLKWMQDGNWPIFNPMRLFLEKHIDKIQNEILDIFKTNDTIWKYYILLNLGNGISDRHIIKEIKKLASNPTLSEKKEDLDQISKELISNKDW